MDWLEIAKEFGPYMGLIFFFIWRDFCREERAHKLIENQNEFIQNELIKLIKESKDAGKPNTQPDRETDDL